MPRFAAKNNFDEKSRTSYLPPYRKGASVAEGF